MKFAVGWVWQPTKMIHKVLVESEATVDSQCLASTSFTDYLLQQLRIEFSEPVLPQQGAHCL